MSIKRGRRKSLILEVGRWRFRAVLGRFVWAWEREHRFGGWSGALSTKFLLITFLQRAERTT
ncbi:MAG: hypothetical protein IT337_05405 [Thermomicrobiales bacterium]|nr:hypothetical protein [Thermomicrobiales bacterium]